MKNTTATPIRRLLATVLAGTAAALAFAAAPVSASTKAPIAQSISGRLVDIRTNRPLVGVQVASYSYADGSRVRTVTDGLGRFNLNDVRGDEFAVVVGRTATHCGGTVKVLPANSSSFDAMTTRRDNANTFRAGNRGTIAVSRHGSIHCP